MRKMIIATAASLLVGGAGVLALAVPASAATTAGTPVTVEITGGLLGITVPVGADLGTVAASASAQTVTAPLGIVLVTDLRGGLLGWVTTAGSTDFTGGSGIPASAETYTPGTTTVVGHATVTPVTLTAMTAGGGTVQTASSVIGVNTASWIPSIAVTIPAGAVAATYSATITPSVS
jgi:hypothetical protein